MKGNIFLGSHGVENVDEIFEEISSFPVNFKYFSCKEFINLFPSLLILLCTFSLIFIVAKHSFLMSSIDLIIFCSLCSFIFLLNLVDFNISSNFFSSTFLLKLLLFFSSNEDTIESAGEDFCVFFFLPLLVLSI